MAYAAAVQGHSLAGERARMLEQCQIWGKWLQEAPALPGKPCNFVNTSRPEMVFRVPDSAVDKNIFQPFPQVQWNWQRFHIDSFLPGGSGAIPPLRVYLALLRASRKLRGQSVHVVQVGANLGGKEFNEWVHPLLRANPDWTGVVIEPVPKVFARLKQNYELEAHRVQPLNVAIATKTGPCSFHWDRKSPQTSTLALGEQVHGVKCFTVQRSCRWLRNSMRAGVMSTISVNCSTLEDALASRRSQLLVPVDLLVLDVEMFDYTLMRTIRFDLIRPLAVEFESKAMTMQQGAEISSLMALQGYLCRFEAQDDMLSRRRTARKDVYYGEKIDFNISLHAPTLPIQPPADPGAHWVDTKRRSRTGRRGPASKPRSDLSPYGHNTLESVCYRMV